MTWALWSEGIESSSVLSEAGRRTLHQAIDTFETFLGVEWLERHRPKTAGDRGLPLVDFRWWPSNDTEHVHFRLLELALRLRLISEGDVPGRRPLRTNMQADLGHFAHCLIQLEVAALALRSGWSARLEPPPILAGGSRVDLLLTHGDGVMAVEVKNFITDDVMQTDLDRSDAIRQRLFGWTVRFGVMFDGYIELPDALDAFEELIGWADGLAEVAATVRSRGQEVMLRPPTGGAVTVVPEREARQVALVMPIRSIDPMRRLLSKIDEKAEQGRDAGPLWLRFDQTTHLYQQLIPRNEPARTRALRGLVLGLERYLMRHRHVAGIVLSRPPSSVSREPVSEVIRILGTGRAVPSTTQAPWYRESLVVQGPNRHASVGQRSTWIEWYAAEASWLDWALDQFGLPPRTELVKPGERE